MNLLEVDSIDVHYGDFQALYGVSVSVAAGETLAIIGANGAGKLAHFGNKGIIATACWNG